MCYNINFVVNNAAWKMILHILRRKKNILTLIQVYLQPKIIYLKPRISEM